MFNFLKPKPPTPTPIHINADTKKHTKFNIVLSNDLSQALNTYCATHNIAKSYVARQAIAAYIHHTLTDADNMARPHRYYPKDENLSHHDKQLLSIRKALRNRESAQILENLTRKS